MFKKILIANRGEIALRIIRACRELGIKTVVVHSEADRDSLHVRFADEDVCIGPGPASQSYLDPKRIISAAEICNADAIHPGYGFLSENPDFADICESCNLKFIGPPSNIIRMMGDKMAAKIAMEKAEVPIIPGSQGILQDVKDALQVAEKTGYPVILKASQGGGGKGMRRVDSDAEMQKSFDIAQQEARASFGVQDLYLEKFISSPRHVEVQIMADSFGNIIHLGERDCTVQRRHQKLIEESPSPVLSPEQRERICRAAVQGAGSIGYQNLGTMEFILDSKGNFYFMEMNARIQVEHTVTEEVVDMDLIKEQIRLAWGEPLGISQSEIEFRGHTLECRINAEDPEKGFRPSPGKITSFHVPGGHGVRVDTHAYALYDIPPHYDSMIAKLITNGKTREEAIQKMQRALEEFIIEGIATTIPFHLRILNNPDFLAGKYDTGFVDRLLASKPELTAVSAGL
ncbi:MAG: acetyl-CoA carboxylase biotin carboxylase subunit [candidate division Zixibacteria bacterium]|nr:acetyl-CoA carboxylase biotin carboxylase subunit [candidate division Zixibacteria bacterium]